MYVRCEQHVDWRKGCSLFQKELLLPLGYDIIELLDQVRDERLSEEQGSDDGPNGFRDDPSWREDDHDCRS